MFFQTLKFQRILLFPSPVPCQKLRVEIIKGRGNNACGKGNNA